MVSVDPIRDMKKVEAMKMYLKGKDIRSYTMFVVGINIALRITDLLSLKWKDVLDERRRFKELKLLENKTGKSRTIKLNTNSRKALKELLDSLDSVSLDDYIFKSRKGENKPITRQRALSVLKDAAKAVGVKENIGTHSLRKIWGYWAWKKGYSPVLIMETLNHYSWRTTKIYLGIAQDDINDLYESHNI